MNPDPYEEAEDLFPGAKVERNRHGREPWRQDGRYIRDASGAIVVRGRTLADARRIVASVNATRDIPTDALENWLVQNVSEPSTRPDLEVLIGEDPVSSPFAVRAPEGSAFSIPVEEAPGAWPQGLTSFERRRGAQRRAERRSPNPVAAPHDLVFDRRVMERRFADRRQSAGVQT